MANELRFVDGDLLFDSDKLAMSSDCCCSVDCNTINNDDSWRSGLEVSYDISGLTLSSGCSGTCASAYAPTGVLAYENDFGGTPGSSRDWRDRVALSCSSCGGDLCYYHTEGRLACVAGTVTIGLRLRMNKFDGTATGMWDIEWEDSMAEASFSLGTTYTLTFIAINLNGGPCQPSSWLSSSADVSFN